MEMFSAGRERSLRPAATRPLRMKRRGESGATADGNFVRARTT